MKNDNRDRSPAGRFIYLAEKRVGKAITAIESVEKLSNRKNYTYTQEQSNQIIAALENSLRQLQLSFENNNQDDSRKFEFSKTT